MAKVKRRNQHEHLGILTSKDMLHEKSLDDIFQGFKKPVSLKSRHRILLHIFALY